MGSENDIIVQVTQITVQVKTFASISEIVQKKDFDFCMATGSTLEDLKSLIFKNERGMKTPLLYAVNHDYATLDTILNNGDEVAIMPMVSGG